MKVLIIAGGKLSDRFLKEMYEYYKADHVIVADGALAAMDRMQLPFHSLVGDFDTIAPEILKKYENQWNLYVERHVPEKNETDSELAIRIAVEKHPTDIMILGAMGGRMDHTLGNIHLMRQCLEREIPCAIYDEWNRITLVKKEAVLKKNETYGKYVSFLPLFEYAENVTLKGFRYPLVNALLQKGTTLAISNEVAEETASVSVENGILICIESKDEGKE